MNSQQPTDGAASCVEHGVWTPVPVAPPDAPDAFTLHFEDIDAAEHDRIVQAGRMTLHLVGCTGDYSDHEPQQMVADTMAAQIGDAGRTLGGQIATASFLYHLGDIIYKPGAGSDVGGDQSTHDASIAPNDDRGQMYNDQFYKPYTTYSRPIFAIAGNHDGKHSPHFHNSAVDHFFSNFCSRGPSADNSTDSRLAMPQPYIYWRLNTPYAYFIGLYSNVANGGILDDPFGPRDGAQYRWLVAQLRDVGTRHAGRERRKAIVLVVHYPPYSGAGNFPQRGDPTLGPTEARGARPLGAVLQGAFAESGQRPDVIVSAHAHLYQRLTYRYADGWEIPCLVAGSGGHSPIEQLFAACDGSIVTPRAVPFDADLPAVFTLPAGHVVQVVAYEDRSFGFMRLTIEEGKLRGEYFTVTPQAVARADAFSLDMTNHTVATTSADAIMLPR